MKGFGTRSKAKIQTCHKDLQEIFNLAIKWSKVDFGVSEGHRSVSRQQDLYAIGRTIEIHKKPITYVDGIKKKSKHNKKPSEAGDVFIYDPNVKTRKKIIYSEVHLSYVAGVLDAAAQHLYDSGKTKHLLRWGGNWDGDGVIAIDQKFDDLPHFELIKVS